MRAPQDTKTRSYHMSDSAALRVGQAVPDFKLETFDPTTNDFGTFDLAAQKAAKKWTILFFYPADFTFV
jgi:peroxiredoxin (alkyl hydroperoxide reductase subunit C)